MSSSGNYILLPTEVERIALFRLLQQTSSLSIWTTIGEYYKAWVDTSKFIHPLVQNAGRDGETAMMDSELQGILSGYAAFQGALAALQKGDKSVFKWLGYGSGGPYFCEAYREISSWRTRYWRAAEWTLPLEDTPYWPKWDASFQDLTDAWDHGSQALERRHTDVPAAIQTMFDFRGLDTDPEGNRLPPVPLWVALMQRVDTLPPVPQPEEETLIKTGAIIPCSGIWEPVKTDMSAGFVGLFKRPIPAPDGHYELDGCMNYLHGGSPAPTIAFEDDDIRQEGRPTVWRLLWEDNRYKEGHLPSVENEYVFVTRRQEDAVVGHIASFAIDELVWRDSGAVAPVSGRWAARDDLGRFIVCQKGDILPPLDSGETVWVHVPRV